MNITEKIKSFYFLWSIIRLIPLYSIFFTLSLYGLTFNLTYLFLMMYIIFSLLLNIFLKNVVFYRLGKAFSILKFFYRPSINKSCLPFSNIDTGRISMGMPSGHSQIISSIAIFSLLNIWYEEVIGLYYPDNNIKKIFHTIIIVLILLITMFSRILDDCHTLTQTIIGTVIGILYGTSAYFLHRKIKYKIDLSKQY